MFQFHTSAPPDLTIYPEPASDDRSGPPLSQGFLLTLIGTVADEYCSPAARATIAQVDPQAWYHGQLLESVLNEFERSDPALPSEVGKNIYYTLRSQFTAMGLKSPSDVVHTLPQIWQFVTRGDSGAWRAEMLGPQQARFEAAQPYNCRFEEGAVVGALEAFDAADVRIVHTQCMRDGAACCVFDVQWSEE